MKTHKFFSALSLLALLAGCATPAPNGRETREWLNLQKGGAAASSETPAMSGEAADKAYQRYVDSFGQPLPESYSREAFTSSQGGGEK